MMQEENKKPNSNDQPRWTLSNPIKRRSSLFGETFNWKEHTKPDELAQNTKVQPDPAIEQYHKQILTEVKQWCDLVCQKALEVKQMEETQLVADTTILTDEQRNYVEDGVNLLREYFAGLDDTKRLLNFYLEERMLLLEAKSDLYVQLNQIADEEAANVIEDALED